MTDEFTKKRALEVMRKAHFDNSKVYSEIATEFGSRFGFAIKEGIPPDIAFETCQEHFKIVGQAMIDIAQNIKFEDGTLQTK